MTAISTIWTRIDPTVQQWILDNPGSIVLPRTLVNRVEATTGEALRIDQHGEYWFSEEELVFLKARRRAAALEGLPAPDSGLVPSDEYAEALDR
ncbi:hypothetical protein [Arthrobacter sp. NPDC092385]|uniref:hypothetical protein n=1 Tax=Arthrobacter sp. NPDC092385 TaxID=3363943 RepID=UPI003802D06B